MKGRIYGPLPIDGIVAKLSLDMLTVFVQMSLPSSIGMTVFLRASTKPSGEPKRKKSDTSKSNFPREPPSNVVLLLNLREAASFRKTLECKLKGRHKISSSC